MQRGGVIDYEAMDEAEERRGLLCRRNAVGVSSGLERLEENNRPGQCTTLIRS